ncbi:MAG: hypothetical protein QNI84_15675 [Henriciella sp.]|nr:hypothetical protein [Henriciella sp.]
MLSLIAGLIRKSTVTLSILACLNTSGCGLSGDPDADNNHHLVELILDDDPIVIAGAKDVLINKLQGLDLKAAQESGRGSEAQYLSMLGRENLIAETHRDYSEIVCEEWDVSKDLISEIKEKAARTRIVIITESHFRTQTRAITADIAEELAPLGYGSFAAEAFRNTDILEGPAPVTESMGLPYPKRDDGWYVQEAAFGRMLRHVKALNYNLVPYEAVSRAFDPTEDFATRQNRREDAQAQNLADYLNANQGSRLLVHVGYSHGSEYTADIDQPIRQLMAARLKDKTGIDPLTINQHHCRGNRELDSPILVKKPEQQPDGAFDLYVDLPRDSFERSRPAWRLRRGDLAVDIPSELIPEDGWAVIEARRLDEPEEAVPIDSVAIRPGEDVALMLPPGRYRVRAVRPAPFE